jgi:hypothetical protein
VPPDEFGVVADWFSVAVLVIGPLLLTLTVAFTVKLNDVPSARGFVIVQVTVPPDSATVVPAGAVPVDTYVSPAGRGSVTTTPDALSGPSPVTVRV